MTCTQPAHRGSNRAPCAKELAVAVAGSSESARRLLKAWVLLGASVGSRAEHMAPSWKGMLLQSLADNTLMQEAELDQIAMLSLDQDVAAPFAAGSADAQATAAQPSPQPETQASKRRKRTKQSLSLIHI
eukprot:536758-Alexandrium_andersonii.AAC.1